jgi:hypothetical protein
MRVLISARERRPRSRQALLVLVKMPALEIERTETSRVPYIHGASGVFDTSLGAACSLDTFPGKPARPFGVSVHL